MYNVIHYTWWVIVSFADKGTEDIFNGDYSKAARQTCPQNLLSVASRKLDMLNQADVLTDLRVAPGNHLEALSGDRAQQHSMRINNQYRVCFTWTEQGPTDVEITDYH
jgi:proteic killer suppression protein